MKKYKFVCNLYFGDIFIQIFAWTLLTIVTLGFALPFFAYYFLRLIINNTELHELA